MKSDRPMLAVISTPTTPERVVDACRHAWMAVFHGRLLAERRAVTHWLAQLEMGAGRLPRGADLVPFVTPTTIANARRRITHVLLQLARDAESFLRSMIERGQVIAAIDAHGQRIWVPATEAMSSVEDLALAALAVNALMRPTDFAARRDAFSSAPPPSGVFRRGSDAPASQRFSQMPTQSPPAPSSPPPSQRASGVHAALAPHLAKLGIR